MVLFSNFFWNFLKLSGWVKIFIKYFEKVRLENTFILVFYLKIFEIVGLGKNFPPNNLKMLGWGMLLFSILLENFWNCSTGKKFFSNILNVILGNDFVLKRIWKFLKLSGWVIIFFKFYEIVRLGDCFVLITYLKIFWNCRTR